MYEKIDFMSDPRVSDFAKEVATLKDKFPHIKYFVIALNEETDETTLIGTMCVVCAADAMIQIIEENHIQHKVEQMHNIVPNDSGTKH